MPITPHSLCRTHQHPLQQHGQSAVPARVSSSFIQIILFVIVIIAANYLSCTNPKRYDLTQRKRLQLSPDFSEKYLNSDAIQKRESPVQIIAVVRRSSPHYTRIYHLLDEYETTREKCRAASSLSTLFARQTEPLK